MNAHKKADSGLFFAGGSGVEVEQWWVESGQLQGNSETVPDTTKNLQKGLFSRANG